MKVSLAISSVKLAAAFTWLGSLRALSRWWWEQILDLGHEGLRLCAPMLHTRTLITLHSDIGTVTVLQGRTAVDLASFERGAGKSWPDNLPDVPAMEQVRGQRALIALGDSFVLKHELQLPDAAERNLRAVVLLHLEREFPLVHGAIVVDQQVVRRMRTQRKVLVRVFVLHRRVLDAVVKAAEAWGVQLAQVGVDAGDRRVEGNFLGHAPKQRAVVFTRTDRGLAIALAVTLVISGLAATGRWAVERYRVGQAIERIKPAALAAKGAAGALERRAAPARMMASVVRAPDAAEVLEALTRRTPDDTWIYHLTIDALPDATTVVDLEAFAPVPENYVAGLENSAEFEQVRLVSSQPDESGGSLKRVRLSATVSQAVSEPRVAALSAP